MTHSLPPTRAVAHALLVAVLAVGVLVPLSARADRGTARLASGGVVTGEIEVYLPGERVVIRTDSGEVLALDIRDLAELQIAPSRPAAPVPPAPAPQAVPPSPPAAAAATTYILVPQYAGAPYAEAPPVRPPHDALRPPPARRPSLFWPLMTLSGSAAAFISGTMLVLDSSYYCGDSYYGDCGGPDPQRVGGLVLMGLSLPLFILSATYLLPRKVRARRAHRAAERAYQLSLVPTADPRAGHYGASATLRF